MAYLENNLTNLHNFKIKIMVLNDAGSFGIRFMSIRGQIEVTVTSQGQFQGHFRICFSNTLIAVFMYRQSGFIWEHIWPYLS